MGFSSVLRTDWESSGFEADKFPIRPAVEDPAGHPWQVAFLQSPLSFHRPAMLYYSSRSWSIAICRPSQGRDSLLLAFGPADLAGSGAFGAPARQDRLGPPQPACRPG